MAQVGKPGGGVSGKPGMGAGGGGAPMSAEQAAAANGTRNQNLYTTVGGLSRPSGAAAPTTPPPTPRSRPSGPSGPPKPGTTGQMTLPQPRPTLDPKVLDPLINSQAPYPTNVRAGQSPPDAAGLPTPGVPEGFAPSATTQLGDYNEAGQYDPLHRNRQHKTRALVSPSSVVRIN
jgi:hypothetical protein